MINDTSSLKPFNPITRELYPDADAGYLAAVARIERFEDPRWVTKEQAQELGWTIAKAEDTRGTVIENWNSREMPGVHHVTVYNAEQMDPVPPFNERLGLANAIDERIVHVDNKLRDGEKELATAVTQQFQTIKYWDMAAAANSSPESEVDRYNSLKSKVASVSERAAYLFETINELPNITAIDSDARIKQNPATNSEQWAKVLRHLIKDRGLSRRIKRDSEKKQRIYANRSGETLFVLTRAASIDLKKDSKTQKRNPSAQTTVFSATPSDVSSKNIAYVSSALDAISLRELNKFTGHIISMSGITQEQLQRSVKACLEKDMVVVAAFNPDKDGENRARILEKTVASHTGGTRSHSGDSVLFKQFGPMHKNWSEDLRVQEASKPAREVADKINTPKEKELSRPPNRER
jgi:hypothetical protein